MSYAFASGEDVETGARRLAWHGAALAIGHLEGRGEGDPIHEARKVIKRVRALVRLVRGAIGDDADAANRLLRDAGRPLSQSRDADVMLETFDALAAKKNPPPDGDAIRRELARERRTAHGHDDTMREGSLDLLRRFAASIETWKFSEKKFDAIEPGLRRSYSNGRHALDAARGDWSPVTAHELRKRAKDLWYHAELLREAWPDVMGAYAHALHELGDLLGDDHDLAVLGDRVAAVAAAPEEVRAAWLVRIAAKREKLRRKALPLATKLYFESPKRFVHRLATWWHA